MKQTPKQVLAFDLDGTLAMSKQPITTELGEQLVALSKKYRICIITGGTYQQITRQVIDKLPENPEVLRKFYLMPVCGTRAYTYESGEFFEKYSDDLPSGDKKLAMRVIEETAKEYGMWIENSYGPSIEDRGSQITYSAIGQQAPLEIKNVWKKKNLALKQKVRDVVQQKLPNLEVRLGGSSSIDVTKPGRNKAYGMKMLMKMTGVSQDEILFFGDHLQPGGNDNPVLEMGIECIAVKDPADTTKAMHLL